MADEELMQTCEWCGRSGDHFLGDCVRALRAALERERKVSTKLRAFALAMYEADTTYDNIGDVSLEVANTLIDCGLTDAHGKPTPLLTGQKDAEG